MIMMREGEESLLSWEIHHELKGMKGPIERGGKQLKEDRCLKKRPSEEKKDILKTIKLK